MLLSLATQNEIILEDARDLIKNGCKLVAEGANMPYIMMQVKIFLKKENTVHTRKSC